LTQNFEVAKNRYLGKGTSGLVYQIVSKNDGLQYVVKIIRIDLKDDPKAFFNEAELMKNLTHPSIVKIYDFHLWSSKPFNYLFLVRVGSTVV